MSDFMTPDIQGCDYYVVTNSNDETTYAPEFDHGIIGHMKEGDTLTIELRSGYLYRLSASGYMDCTDWTPADTYQEAIEELLENDATWADDDDDERTGPYEEDWANDLHQELQELKNGKPVL